MNPTSNVGLRLKPAAILWLESTSVHLERPKRALLSNVDGRRSLVELESFARAIGFWEHVWRLFEDEGLIERFDD